MTTYCGLIGSNIRKRYDSSETIEHYDKKRRYDQPPCVFIISVMMVELSCTSVTCVPGGGGGPPRKTYSKK